MIPAFHLSKNIGSGLQQSRATVPLECIVYILIERIPTDICLSNDVDVWQSLDYSDPIFVDNQTLRHRHMPMMIIPMMIIEYNWCVRPQISIKPSWLALLEGQEFPMKSDEKLPVQKNVRKAPKLNTTVERDKLPTSTGVSRTPEPSTLWTQVNISRVLQGNRGFPWSLPWSPWIASNIVWLSVLQKANKWEKKMLFLNEWISIFESI